MEKKDAKKGVQVVINYAADPNHQKTGKILSTHGGTAKVAIDSVFFTQKVSKKISTVEIMIAFLEPIIYYPEIQLKTLFPDENEVKSSVFLEYMFSSQNMCMIEGCKKHAHNRAMVNLYNNLVKEFDLCKKHFSRFHGTHQMTIPMKMQYITHQPVPRVLKGKKG